MYNNTLTTIEIIKPNNNMSVKLKFIDFEKKSNNYNKIETLLHWPASNIPSEAKFSLETSPKTNKTVINAESVVNFSSCNTINENDDGVNYFIASLNHVNRRLICYPSQVFQMFPNHDYQDSGSPSSLKSNLNESSHLTKKEQLDELKLKFGSKKSQRDLGKFI